MNIARLSLRYVHHLPSCRASFSLPTRIYSTSSSSMPKIADTSVWTSMIPKFLCNRKPKDPKDSKSKEWNPASFYIIIFTLIGSQAIRMIALKNDYAAYTRSTDAKIELLRGVIEKVKKGEDVDVEKLLGTGEQGKEREWDEVLREIEAEDSLWHRKPAQPETPKEDKTQMSTEKDPAVPSAVKAEEPLKQNRPARKLNFF